MILTNYFFMIKNHLAYFDALIESPIVFHI